MPIDAATRPWLRGLLIVALAMIVPLLPFVVVGELPGRAVLQAQAEHAVWFGFTGFVLLCADVFLPIPSSIVGSMLGMRLGMAPAFFWVFLGLQVGHLVGYGTARGLLTLRGRGRPSTAPTALPLGVWLVVLTRSVPVFAEAVALAAGATRMPFARFLAACAVGNALYALVLVANGDLLLTDNLSLLGWLLPLSIPVAGYLWYRRRLRI